MSGATDNDGTKLLDVIGDGKIFDQVAVVFKASTERVIYNFTLADLLATLPTPPGPDENFAYRGEWNLAQQLFNNGGNTPDLSHISLWFRDPIAQDIQVPLPGTLFLLGLGALGLSVRRRYPR